MSYKGEGADERKGAQMTVIVLDDEKIALEGMVRTVKKVLPDAEVLGFRKAKDAVKAGIEKKCSIAFLDIEMKDMNGIEAAELLRSNLPAVNIIMTTAYAEYSLKALSMHVSGYLLKPVTEEKIRYELDHLRYAIGEEKEEPAIKIRAFGSFEIFWKDKPMKFKYAKTKELVALLVDRKGAFCSNAEIEAILWEDDEPHAEYLKKIKQDLRAAMSALGCEDVILAQRGQLAITRTGIDCDYFRFLDGEKDAVEAYRGEYMEQFSWAEYTKGGLNNG